MRLTPNKTNPTTTTPHKYIYKNNNDNNNKNNRRRKRRRQGAISIATATYSMVWVEVQGEQPVPSLPLCHHPLCTVLLALVICLPPSFSGNDLTLIHGWHNFSSLYTALEVLHHQGQYAKFVSLSTSAYIIWACGAWGVLPFLPTRGQGCSRNFDHCLIPVLSVPAVQTESGIYIYHQWRYRSLRQSPQSWRLLYNPVYVKSAFPKSLCNCHHQNSWGRSPVTHA